MENCNNWNENGKMKKNVWKSVFRNKCSKYFFPKRNLKRISKDFPKTFVQQIVSKKPKQLFPNSFPKIWNTTIVVSTNSAWRLIASQILVCKKTIMSSRYTMHISHCRPARTHSMSLSKVAPAHDNPKGMRLNSKRPLDVTNAVFGASLGCIPHW